MARPREFNRAKALEQAVEAFWELGYEHTSTAVLVERLGIGRSSLYAAFGNKEQLYAEAMDSYIEDLRVRVVGRLQGAGPAMKVLEDFLLGVADRRDPGSERVRCCMIVRASLSAVAQPPEIEQRIKQTIAELDDAFHALLRRARNDGTLRGNSRLRDSARFLTTTFQALNIATNAGRSKPELREIVRRALAGLQ